jgi:hypothetical protein
MTKHTPGPWKLELGRDGAPRGLRGPAEVEHRNIVNWNGFSSPTKPASMANARLIAAAPELLAELEETHAALCFTHNYIGTERYKRNRAAIAKARGEA